MPISNLTDYFGSKEDQMKRLKLSIKTCIKCDTSVPRVTAYGCGSLDAKIMVVGESPWIKDVWLKLEQEELDMVLEQKYGDKTCFGDLAGRTLSKIFELAGINEEDVYFTNSVKCSMQNNLKPSRHEAALCSAWLTGEIAIVKPKVVLAASHVARDFFKVEPNGVLKHPDGYVVIGVYHPSYVSRYPDNMDKTVKQYSKALRYLK